MATEIQGQLRETYIPRVDQYQDWYDKKAVWAKRRYMQSKITAALSAVLIPVILNIDSIPFFGEINEISVIVATSLGVIVSCLLALENVLKYKEQWVNYRSTEQFLVREKILYRSQSGPYLNMAEDVAFHRFIGVCEDAIQNENQATLNVLTRDETKNNEKPS